MYRRLGKRCFDLVLAVPAFLLMLPLMLLLAALVRIYLGPRVLFRQTRPGLDEQPFTLYKFRTMTDARSPSGKLLSDAERLPAFGRLLRSTSLDELPGLINVIRGEMSLVGPRPLLMSYLEHYSPEQRCRHNVRPGITGWAQVNGRNALGWDERFALDLWYVQHYSLWVDLKILAFTVIKVLRRVGITQEGHATVEEFRGSSPSYDSRKP